MKFWMTFTFYLLGVLSGILLWEKVDMKTVLKGRIKLKQRGHGNTQLTDIRPDIDAKTKREQRKSTRQAKRAARKAKKHGRTTTEKDN